MEKTAFKFKVALWEYERGWGSRLDDIVEKDTYEEAIEYIKDFNKGNTEESVPDWYMIARAHNFEIQKPVK
jgi:hypothetical protein